MTFLSNPNINKTEKIMLIISYVIKFTLILAIPIAIYEKNYMTLFLSIMALILIFSPAMLKRNYKIILPTELEFILIIFIYGALYLGEIREYYFRYWWWDIFLHTISGIILGIIGFLIVYIINKESKIDNHINSFFISVFSFTFAVTLGVIWEIFEFTMDQLFGLNMQKSGLVDTMADLIVDSLGALLISILGYFYVKKTKRSSPIFEKMIDKFLHLNQRLHKKKRNNKSKRTQKNNRNAEIEKILSKKRL